MKTIASLGRVFVALLLLAPATLFSQDEQYLVVTTRHRDMNSDMSFDEWLSLEKEYLEKVINKHNLVSSASVYTHLYSNDNSEVIYVTVYNNWADIEEANEIEQKLIEEAWPIEADRKAFFDRLESAFINQHSDEIYLTVPGGKYLPGPPDQNMIMYVRTSELSDASRKNFIKDFTEGTEIYRQNEYIKAFYPNRHLYGKNSNDLIEAFMYASMEDMEKAAKRNGEIFESLYATEEERKSMSERMSAYFTGKHSDAIYQPVPGLFKASTMASRE